MTKYLPRIIDSILKVALEANGAVLIEGPKWCGKTFSAKQIAKSVLMMQNPDYSASYINTAKTKPSLLLEGDKPRLLDEWQMAPVLWDAVRYSIDETGSDGLYILTGSSLPKDGITMHTGTGRISRILMRPMSLFESQESNGSVSLAKLFAQTEDPSGVSKLSLENVAFLTCRGGWPKSINLSEKVALKQVYDYTDALINTDASKVDDVHRDPTKVRLLFRSLARNLSTDAGISTITNDIKSDGGTLSDETVREYLTALRKIFIVDDLSAWSPKLRSKSVIRSTQKHHFVDPSIGIASLRVSPQDLMDDLNTFGFFFESLCIRDLRIYSQSLDGDVFYYRDSTGLECDAIIHLRNGKWGAIEVKLGEGLVDDAARNLIKLKNKIDTNLLKSPSFLMVLTATQYAYKREDGVIVVPLGCLKY
jgi:predicted AAA+ superfamily ATPase